MAYVKVPAPSVVYHLVKADRLDSILDDGQIRRFEDSECWFCESLPKMKAYMEQTVMCEGKPYYAVGGQLCRYPKFVPEDYVLLTRTPCLCSSAMISAEVTLRQRRKSRRLQSPSCCRRRASPCAVCMPTCCKSVASTARYSMPSCTRSSSTKAVKDPGTGQRNTTTPCSSDSMNTAFPVTGISAGCISSKWEQHIQSLYAEINEKWIVQRPGTIRFIKPKNKNRHAKGQLYLFAEPRRGSI